MSIDNVGSSLGITGGDPKTTLMNQVRQEAALNNARQLIEVCHIHPLPFIPPSSQPLLPVHQSLNPLPPTASLTPSQKLNEHCFAKCIPKPGSSFTSGEQQCFSQCMEKYMSAWNTVSQQYIARVQQEGAKSAGGGMF